MIWARLILAVSLLVGWTSAAAAECAWVLWSQSSFSYVNRPEGGNMWWDVERGYQIFEDCTAGRDRLAAHHASVERSKPGTTDFSYNRENSTLGYIREGRYKTLSYKCFPDTIDPREKKQ